tara:strand:- start:85 stop:303 length:219 start_codon:yes stop_codon:yes gene_type:complete
MNLDDIRTKQRCVIDFLHHQNKENGMSEIDLNERLDYITHVASDEFILTTYNMLPEKFVAQWTKDICVLKCQ